MPITTVVNVTAGGKRPICSCSWEGETVPGSGQEANKEAWQAANRHARDEHGTTAGRDRG